MSLIRNVIATVMLMGACGGSSTDPDDDPPAGVTHPAGVIVATTALSARPFGIDIGTADLVYASRLDAAAVSHANGSTHLVTGHIASGDVPTDVQFAPNGRTAYTSNQFSASVSVIDVASAAQVGVIPVSGNPFKVIVSRDGARVYVTTNVGRVVVINAETRAVIKDLPAGSAPNGFAFSNDNNFLYVSSFIGGTITEIDTRTLVVTRSLTIGGTPQGMVMSPSGTELFVADESGGVKVVNVASGTVSSTITLSTGAFDIAMAPDQKQLYASLPGNATVAVIDPATKAIVKSIPVGGVPRRIAFNEKGTLAVVANEAGSIVFIQ